MCLHTGFGFLNENRVLVLLVFYDLFTACLHIRNSNPPLNEQLLYQKHDPQWLCCLVLFCFFVYLFWGESLGSLECYFILAVRATVANKELSLCSTTRQPLTQVGVGRETQSDHKAVGILNHVKLFHMFLRWPGVTITHLANRSKGYILIQGHRKIQTKGLIKIK